MRLKSTFACGWAAHLCSKVYENRIFPYGRLSWPHEKRKKSWKYIYKFWKLKTTPLPRYANPRILSLSTPSLSSPSGWRRRACPPITVAVIVVLIRRRHQRISRRRGHGSGGATDPAWGGRRPGSRLGRQPRRWICARPLLRQPLAPLPDPWWDSRHGPHSPRVRGEGRGVGRGLSDRERRAEIKKSGKREEYFLMQVTSWMLLLTLC